MVSFPAPEEIIRDWIRNRSEAGVVLAQAVTDVTADDGRMTIHINPDGIARAKEWPAAIATYPEGIADFYATQFGPTNDQADYLRKHISTLEVVDAEGNRIGNIIDTAKYRLRKNPDLHS